MKQGINNSNILIVIKIKMRSSLKTIHNHSIINILRQA